MDREQRDELRRWADRLARGGSTAEAQAAGRAIDLLLDELERLERVLGRTKDELEERQEAERAEARREAEREARRAHRRRRRPDPGRRLVVVPAGEAPAAAVEAPAMSWPEAEMLPADPLGNGGDEGGGAVPDLLPAERLESQPTRPRRRRRPPRRLRAPRLRRPGRPRPRTVAAVGIAALAAAGAGAGLRIAAPELTMAGPSPGALIGAAAAERLVFSIASDPGTLARARWTVDGRDVTGQATLAAGRSLLHGSTLLDGEHEVAAFVERGLPVLSSRRVWRISIDRTPPEIAVDPTTARGAPGRPLVVRGRVEAGATVAANRVDAVVENGFFELRLPEPPAKPIALVATDRHGNASSTELEIALVPRLPRAPIRSVHVTFHAWADDELRAGIMRLVDEGRINSVELDLKDESGVVGFAADVPFARQIGAVEEIYDLEEAVDLLHGKGVHVIGRLVAFRDPIHARAAWRRGWKAQVVQSPGGGLYAGYGGFTNFASPAVRRYNIEIAKAAAEAGVDDILFDYVRRPDGPPGSMVFPGLQGTPEASIASFLGQARRQLRPYDVFLGASVFGVAATRPKEVAQNIRAIARNVDYVAPMLYPSHWSRGEYDVGHPNAQPYDIVLRSLKDFQEQTKGTGARLVPWLQDFSLGVAYGPAEVRAQIGAASDVGIEEWILWDPLVTYTADALDRKPLQAPIQTRRGQPAEPPTTPQS